MVSRVTLCTLYSFVSFFAFFTLYALVAFVSLVSFFALSSLCAVFADYLAEIYRCSVAVCYNKFAESVYLAACNAYAVGAVITVITV